MDLLAFERKLDQTIMRKRVDIQEALKRPMKVCPSTHRRVSKQRFQIKDIHNSFFLLNKFIDGTQKRNSIITV